MASSEAGGNPPDITAIINEVTRTLNGEAGADAPAGAGFSEAAEDGGEPVKYGSIVTVGVHPNGEVGPIAIEFATSSRGENQASSPEMRALWLAIDAYAGTAREKREERQRARIADFPTMFEYLDHVEGLDDEIAMHERRSTALNQLVDGLKPATNRPDGRTDVVSVLGADAPTVYEAMMFGFRRLAEEQSEGDPEAYDRILSEHIDGMYYGSPLPGQGGLK